MTLLSTFSPSLSDHCTAERIDAYCWWRPLNTQLTTLPQTFTLREVCLPGSESVTSSETLHVGSSVHDYHCCPMEKLTISCFV